MGRLYELSSLYSGLQNLFWFQYKEHKVGLTKIPMHSIFKLVTTVSYIFSKSVYCDMRFLVEKK